MNSKKSELKHIYKNVTKIGWSFTRGIRVSRVDRFHKHKGEMESAEQNDNKN